jgi:hypothetical protein
MPPLDAGTASREAAGEPATDSIEEADLLLERQAPAPVPIPDGQELLGYCARCRARRYLKGALYVRTKRGRPAIRGACVICGSGMLVFTTEDEWQQKQEEWAGTATEL